MRLICEIIKEREGHINELSGRLSAYQLYHSALYAKKEVIKALEQQLGDLKIDLEQLSEVNRQLINSLKENQDLNTGKINELEELIKTLKYKASGLEQSLSAKTTKINNMQKSIEAHRVELSNIKELNREKIKKLNDRIAALHAKLETAKQASETSQATEADLRVRISGLETEGAAEKVQAVKQIAALTAEIEATEKALATQCGQEAGLRVVIAGMQHDFMSMSMEIARTREIKDNAAIQLLVAQEAQKWFEEWKAGPGWEATGLKTQIHRMAIDSRAKDTTIAALEAEIVELRRRLGADQCSPSDRVVVKFSDDEGEDPVPGMAKLSFTEPTPVSASNR